MAAVSIVIITYARQDLLRACLDTCTPQTSAIPGGFEIVVVDNNPAGTARPLVEEIAAAAPVPVRYVHETKPGIPNARNAGIHATESPFIAFVDDDQTITPDWLELMTRAIEAERVDCLFSNVEPVYSKPGLSPAKAVADSYRRYRGQRGSGGTLFRRDTCATDANPFDPAMAFTGGSDTDFYTRLDGRDCRFGWCMEAIAYEYVPADRVNLRYVMKRQYAGGQHYAWTQIRYSGSPPLTAAKIFVKAVLQSGALGLAALASPLMGRDRRAYMLLRLSGALGKLCWPLKFELRRRPVGATA
ncbi:glycosyltransferase family 2 protein [Amorphus sp. MBR-141]